MVTQTKKEKVHHLIIREARKPLLLPPEDVFPEIFSAPIVLVYGAQSALGDFSPYIATYIDALKVFNIFKFSQSSMSLVSTRPDAVGAIEQCYVLAKESLGVSNSALKSLGVEEMTLKCMVCRV